MIDIKTNNEIQKMRVGGKILAEVLFEILRNAKPGVSELELDDLAEKLIRKKGAEPGFKKVPGYKNTICVSVNEVVVHGIPTDYKLKPGDILGIDCGVYLEGFHTDMAETIRVESSELRVDKDEVDSFLKTGKEALDLAIEKAKIGNRTGHISETIQNVVEAGGYSVVRSLIGHGVGKELHEEPEVPGYLHGKIEKTPLLVEGMTIAVEVIYNMGKHGVAFGNKDKWTVITQDGSLSGLFERTIAVTNKGPEILTA